MSGKTIEIVLVRHGESEANLKGIIQGRGDYGLSGAGWEQAKITARALAGLRFDKVFASPLKRAFMTASIICGGEDMIETLDDLMEYNLGEFEGLTVAEVFERFPNVLPALKAGTPFHLLAPGGEKDEDADARAERVLARLLGLECERALVVSHLGILERLVVALAGGGEEWKNWDWPLKNCSITRIRTGNSGPILAVFNDVAHLAAAGKPGRTSPGVEIR